MIKLKYEWINNGAATQALDKLCNMPTFDIKSAYTLGKIQEKVHREVRDARKLFHEKILKKHVELDEKGEVKWGEKGFTVLPDHNEEFEKEEKTFLALEVQIDRPQLKMAALEAANEKLVDQRSKLTPKDLVLLEPLIDHEVA